MYSGVSLRQSWNSLWKFQMWWLIRQYHNCYLNKIVSKLCNESLWSGSHFLSDIIHRVSKVGWILHNKACFWTAKVNNLWHQCIFWIQAKLKEEGDFTQSTVWGSTRIFFWGTVFTRGVSIDWCLMSLKNHMKGNDKACVMDWIVSPTSDSYTEALNPNISECDHIRRYDF